MAINSYFGQNIILKNLFNIVLTKLLKLQCALSLYNGN